MAMNRWFALIADGLDRTCFPDIAAAMFDLGAAGVAEEGDRGIEAPVRQSWDRGSPEPPSPTVRLRAWFEAPDESVRAAAEACLPPGGARCWESTPDEDWANSWKVNFPVFRIGRLVVSPPWNVEPGSLILEPGQGFGTGQHATTRQVLERLVALVDSEPRGRVLDVGCGSGILALAAAHFGADAYGIDHDQIAVDDARSQAVRNGLNVAFDATPLADVTGRWDIVVANMFADTIIELADLLIAKASRHLILGGILADREPPVRELFDVRFGRPVRRQDGDWVCLHYDVAG